MKLIIKVDMNDADYNTQISDITKEQLERFIPVFEAIKNFHPYVTYTNRAVDDGIGSLEWRHKAGPFILTERKCGFVRRKISGKDFSFKIYRTSKAF